MKHTGRVKKCIAVFLSKALLMIAAFFAICPCVGKMYEPEVPEKLRK